ncbi:ankyrin repeat domain-containing protein 31-like [Heteronotia binoei]|uniref:ankyrin repeat domain-containing protein 31-like n=1 Tax=Heteronotia binoei TaxID=13085 RepID=UPI00292FC9B9|nr:ankyrin repeat domain-containing protein 31-like [Heteronotia binoei]
MGDSSDTDSDETIIEGSVSESDLEEEALHVKRLSLVTKDVVSATHNIVTEIKDINEEELSPEIQRICRNSTCTEMLKYPEQIILQYSEDEKEESQSLLQAGITYPVISAHICQTDCSSAAVVHGEGSHFTCLDSGMTEFLETSEKNVLQILNVDSSETCLCSGTDTVEVGRDSVLRCTEISGIFQSITMTNKKDMIRNDQAPEIFASDLTENRIMAEPSQVKGVREKLSDFDSQMVSPAADMLEYQIYVYNMDMDASANEESNALPVELLTAVNSMSGSLVGSDDQAVEKKSVHSTGKKQSILDQTDDCLQTADTNSKPKLHLEQHEATEISMITKSSCHSEPDCNQHTYKLVFSEDQSIMSYNKSTILNETSSSEQTIQETLHTVRRSARKRRYFTHDCVYATLNGHRFLEGFHQKKQSYKAQKRLPAKNYEYDMQFDYG